MDSARNHEGGDGMRRTRKSNPTPTEHEWPIVAIEQEELRSMWKIGRGFDGAIRLVRNRMAGDGIDYRLPFRSWFDERGALCHQNMPTRRTEDLNAG